MRLGCGGAFGTGCPNPSCDTVAVVVVVISMTLYLLSAGFGGGGGFLMVGGGLFGTGWPMSGSGVVSVGVREEVSTIKVIEGNRAVSDHGS